MVRLWNHFSIPTNNINDLKFVEIILLESITTSNCIVRFWRLKLHHNFIRKRCLRELRNKNVFNKIIEDVDKYYIINVPIIIIMFILEIIILFQSQNEDKILELRNN